MPFLESALGTTALAVGAQGIATGTQAAVTGKSNRKTREYNTSMYWTQRRNALSDWEMNNDYNSPIKQMARLREAGLNPNLIYGSGSAQTGNAGEVRGVQTPSLDRQTPDMSGISRLGGAYINAQQQRAELDNTRAQNSVIQNQAALLEAQRLAIPIKNRNIDASTENIQSGTNINSLIAQVKSANQITDVAYRKQQLSKLLADTNFTIDSNSRAAVQQTSNLKDAVQKRLNMSQEYQYMQPARYNEINARIKQLGLANELAEYEKKIRQIVPPGTPWYYRLGASAVQTIYDRIKEASKFDTKPTGAFGKWK